MDAPEWVHLFESINGADLLLWGIAIGVWLWARRS